MAVTLRPVLDADMTVFYRQQLSERALHMAAFPPGREWAAFEAHWVRFRERRDVTLRTILHGDAVVGYLCLFDRNGEPEVGYWLGEEHWGKGSASRALEQFVRLVPRRPLYARIASDHEASMRVAEKAGFVRVGTEAAFAHARGHELETAVFRLD